MTEHPSHCPTCKNAWDFGTDAIGRLIAIHPVAKCVPPPPPVFDAADESDDYCLEERPCDECHKPFRRHKAAPSQRVCSAKCRAARVFRLHQERRALREREWVLKLETSGDLPIKHCEECSRPFSQANPLGGKQIICSAACKRARNTRKSRESKRRRAA